MIELVAMKKGKRKISRKEPDPWKELLLKLQPISKAFKEFIKKRKIAKQEDERRRLKDEEEQRLKEQGALRRQNQEEKRLKKEKRLKAEEERKLKEQQERILGVKRQKEEEQERERQARIYKERLAKGEQERLNQLERVNQLKEEEKLLIEERNLMREIRLKKGQRHAKKDWLNQHRLAVYLLILVGGFMSLYRFIDFRLSTQLATIFSGVLSIFYPFGLRKIPFIKIFVISFVWTISSMLLLVLENNIPISQNIVLHLIARFLFVFAITIPFDIKDLKYDAQSLRTIPLFFGVSQSRFIAVFVLFAD